MQKLSQINEITIYTTTLPSSGVKIKYRPFLSKEERILLTAGESEDVDVMYASLEAVVRNCLLSEVKQLTTFDIEYMFVQLRARSVGESSDVLIKCSSCEKETMNSVDLFSASIVTPEGHSTKIKLSDNIVGVMRYPSIEDVVSLLNSPTNEELKEELARKCILAIYFGEDVYNMEEETEDEKQKFFETFRPDQTQKLKDFIDSMPYLQLTHKWVCPHCKTENIVTLKGIFSFF